MQKTNSIVVFILCKRRFEISILPKYGNNRIIPILLVQLDISKVIIFYKIFGNILTSHTQWYVHYAWSKPQLAFQFILFQIILKTIKNLMWTELHLTAPPDPSPSISTMDIILVQQ